jgi:guanylate kinase
MDHDDVIQKLKTYEPSEPAKELVRTTPILLLVGISGAGKDTIKHHLLTDKADKYHHIVSHTTRKMRTNKGIIEQNGVEYYFIDWDKAGAMIEARSFIEANLYAANIYGTSVVEIEKAKLEGKVAVADLEVQGVEEYKQISPDVKAVFLLPPSYAVWQERYRNRYGGELTKHSEDIQRRMETALMELNLALTAGYFIFVVNDKLEDTVEVVDAIAHGKQHDDQAKARELVHKLIGALSVDLNRN